MKLVVNLVTLEVTLPSYLLSHIDPSCLTFDHAKLKGI